jgi:hypothetical protein
MIVNSQGGTGTRSSQIECRMFFPEYRAASSPVGEFSLPDNLVLVVDAKRPRVNAWEDFQAAIRKRKRPAPLVLADPCGAYDMALAVDCDAFRFIEFGRKLNYS